MRRYAQDTTVPEARTRAELEKLLQLYGANAFSYSWFEEDGGSGTVIAFRIAGRIVQMLVPMPDRRDPLICQTPTGNPRSESQVEEHFAREARRRWRALFAVVKAKLVAVQDGISTIEREFLADIVLPNGKTLGSHLAPKLEEAYSTGKMPAGLLPGAST